MPELLAMLALVMLLLLLLLFMVVSSSLDPPASYRYMVTLFGEFLDELWMTMLYFSFEENGVRLGE